MNDLKDKDKNSNIQEYAFHSFDKLEADILGKREVKGFDFPALDGKKKQLRPEFDKVIRQERINARDKSFEINPVVLKHRGIQAQEDEEREARIQEEVERRLAEVYNHALDEGRKEGIELGRQEVFQQTRALTEEKLESLTEMIGQVLTTKEDILQAQKKEIFYMIRNMTKWIILRELKEDGTYLERLLEKLIIELQARQNLLIQVNKNDFSHMPEILQVVQQRLGTLNNVRLEVDFDISPNGITIESENGIITGTLETQFKNLDKLFESVGIYEQQEN